MLKASPPSSIKKRLKAFIYGREKVGKTTCCLQFPKPYLIDTENGAIHDQYVELLKKSGGVSFQTGSFEEVLQEIHSLRTERHPYKTVIIDSLTMLYSNLVDYYQGIVDNKFAGHYQKANQQFQRLMAALLDLDMNVLLTAHAKTFYDVSKTNGKVSMEALGDTFDCYKKTPYLFDLILEVRNIGGERLALVKGSRLEGFKEGENFQFNYPNFCERYNIETMEREAIQEQAATAEQIEEANQLITLLHIPEETTAKWFSKYHIATFEEMSKEIIQNCIDYLKAKLPQDKL